MAFKRLSEFKREDYIYNSPDGDEWHITVVQTSDRKYVEIKKEGEEIDIRWDVEMLLDIADAVRSVSKQNLPLDLKRSNKLKGPKITDHREQPSNRADRIEAEVEESMENIDIAATPVESFVQDSRHSLLEDDVKRRKQGIINHVPEEAKIRRA